jgi:uridine monophosphate synthetase
MENIIKQLKKNNCIKEGNFRLKNGEYSKYYFDMKNLVSHPKLLTIIGDEIYNKHIKNIEIKNIIICGVPLGGLPIATYISTKYNIPMIMLRDKVKNYGTQKQIEGEYNIDNNCILIEDVITTGYSVKETLELLKNKINILSICCIINRSDINNINNINVNQLLNKETLL